jgi:hypothetical protein
MTNEIQKPKPGIVAAKEVRDSAAWVLDFGLWHSLVIRHSPFDL